MKTKRILSFILALIVALSVLALPTAAAEKNAALTEIEIYIENDDISEETRAKIIAYYSNPEQENGEAATYGLTCTLLGHKLEASTVETITHKARSTAPRCLLKTYDYECCTRCDYESSTLLTSKYIHCCS